MTINLVYTQDVWYAYQVYVYKQQTYVYKHITINQVYASCRRQTYVYKPMATNFSLHARVVIYVPNLCL